VAKNETELATGLALGSPGTTNIARIRLQIWWGEAPERPYGFTRENRRIAASLMD